MPKRDKPMKTQKVTYSDAVQSLPLMPAAGPAQMGPAPKKVEPSHDEALNSSRADVSRRKSLQKQRKAMKV
jgi:hypothetical protein